MGPNSDWFNVGSQSSSTMEVEFVLKGKDSFHHLLRTLPWSSKILNVLRGRNRSSRGLVYPVAAMKSAFPLRVRFHSHSIFTQYEFCSAVIKSRYSPQVSCLELRFIWRVSDRDGETMHLVNNRNDLP